MSCCARGHNLQPGPHAEYQTGPPGCHGEQGQDAGGLFREALEAGLFAANRLVGMIGFNTIDGTARRSEIGYWIDSEYQGQGIVTQGCRSLIAHGFNELDLNRIEIRCATGNDRSRAIAERLGFIHEGTIRQTEWLYDHFEDHALYALLRSEWNRAL